MVISGQSARRVESSRGRLRRWSWGWCARRRGSRPWWWPKAQLSTPARLLRNRGRGRGRRRHDVRRHTDDTCNSNQLFCCCLLPSSNLAMTRMDMDIVYFMLVEERNCGRTNEIVNRLVQFESLIGWLSISIKIRVRVLSFVELMNWVWIWEFYLCTVY